MTQDGVGIAVGIPSLTPLDLPPQSPNPNQNSSFRLFPPAAPNPETQALRQDTVDTKILHEAKHTIPRELCDFSVLR